MKIINLTTGSSLGMCAALAVFAVAFTPRIACADTSIWTGGASAAGWGTGSNWSPTGPAFNNTFDAVFNTPTAGNLTSFIGGTSGRTVRSLTFNADADAPVNIYLGNALPPSADRVLTLNTDADGGNTTITVDSGAAGNFTIGYEGLFGSITLADNLVVDHNGSGTLTIARPINESGASMSVTKLGSGTLIFAGANSYTGNTTVSNGILAFVTTAQMNPSGLITVNDGAGIGLIVSNTVPSVGLNNVTLGSAGASPTTNLIQLDLGAPAYTPLYITSLTIIGKAYFNVSGANLTVGQFPLIQYYIGTGVTDSAVTNLVALPAGTSGYLLNNTAAGTIDLVITSAGNAPRWITWNGNISGDWNINTTANWKDFSLNPTTYKEYAPDNLGDLVTFDDTLSNPSQTSINLSTTVRPTSVTVSGSLPYSFSGPGKISGPATLSFSGSSSLTLSTANDYSGGSTLAGGAVILANNAALGVGGITLAGSSLSSDNSTSRTITNAVSITASTTLGDAIANGTLTFTGPLDFGGGGRALINPSDVIFAGGASSGRVSTKQGSGTLTFQGDCIFTGTADYQEGTVVFDGATVNSTERIIPDAAADLMAHLIITNGTTINITNTASNLRIGRNGTGTNILDLAGLWSVPLNSKASVQLQGSAAHSEVTFWPGGDFTAYAVTSLVDVGNTIFNFNGGILRAQTNNPTFFEGIASAYVKGGGGTIDDQGWAITINQALLDGGGNGMLTKMGTGTLLLNGINTYTGTTLVSQGALGGTGVIAGPVNVAANATLAPGETIGTLTINNNLTIAENGSVSVDVNKDDLTADLVTGLNNVTYAGSLIVTNVGATPLAGGETFQLFSAAGNKSGNFSSITVLPATGATGAFDPATGILTINASSIPTTPTNVTFSFSGGNLNLSWPEDYTGWIAQSNSVNVADPNAWYDIPGSSGVNSLVITPSSSEAGVFYRLRLP